MAAETESSGAEQSTCQPEFKEVEAGHTPGVKTADRDNFPSLSASFPWALISNRIIKHWLCVYSLVWDYLLMLLSM